MAPARRTLRGLLAEDVDGSTPTVNSVASSQERRWQRQGSECGCSSPAESCCSSASLARSDPETGSRQPGSLKEPQQCRGRLCRTNPEVGAGHRDSGQRQFTISRVDFTFEEAASCVHITNRRTIGYVSAIRGTSPKTTCSGRGSSEEGCRDSVQVRGGTSRGARQIEAFAGGGSSITHEFDACRPSRRSVCIAESHFGARGGSTIASAWCPARGRVTGHCPCFSSSSDQPVACHSGGFAERARFFEIVDGEESCGRRSISSDVHVERPRRFFAERGWIEQVQPNPLS